MNTKKIPTRELCYIALFVAVVAVLAQINIPMPLGVPLTLQTFAVMLAGIILGSKKAAIALIVYLLLGAVGVPVFTLFGGGFHRITGPWGGFLMSYPVMAFVIGLGADSGKKHWLAVCLTAGAVINLSAGMFWLAFVSKIGLTEAFAAAFAPFVIPEGIKMVMAFSIGLPVRYALSRIKFKSAA
ncbi:MAG: biotin transporter BioY [Oscillospiraceae bacterium]|nr:biotin transporter BioY [Oscillospiraceae bacterium]